MELGAEVEVVRNDDMSASQALSSGAQAFLISPGPKTPNEAGVSLELVAACEDAGKPLLGVCLGHQTIGQHFGGTVVRGGLMHGKTSQVTHDGSGLFTGLPSPFTATRYHSLVIEKESLPDCLEITAWTQNDDGSMAEIMGVKHRTLALEGVQFHPESILTEHGHDMLRNFLTAY